MASIRAGGTSTPFLERDGGEQFAMPREVEGRGHAAPLRANIYGRFELGSPLAQRATDSNRRRRVFQSPQASEWCAALTETVKWAWYAA